jgi:hypothetical protein
MTTVSNGVRADDPFRTVSPRFHGPRLQAPAGKTARSVRMVFAPPGRPARSNG